MLDIYNILGRLIHALNSIVVKLGAMLTEIPNPFSFTFVIVPSFASLINECYVCVDKESDMNVNILSTIILVN